MSGEGNIFFQGGGGGGAIFTQMRVDEGFFLQKRG